MSHMNQALRLPAPRLSEGFFNSVSCFTDERLWDERGIRIAFTTRLGGVSKAPYEGLNLLERVGDHPEAVRENRRILLDSLGFPDAVLANPYQVHGDEIVALDDPGTLELGIRASQEGADGLVVGLPNVAALLCFADCVPVIIVAPTGRFAVVHAGWRGVVSGIAPKALGMLSQGCQPSQCNIYLGPYIHGECFETGADVHALFVDKFGERCARDATHIDLGAALRASLEEAGADLSRIVEVGACTMCHPEKWFSHRAEHGVCGRHGALAVRKEG